MSYESFFLGMDRPAARIDKAGCVADANASMAAVLGLPRDELLGQPLLAFVHTDDRCAVRGLLDEAPYASIESSARLNERVFLWRAWAPEGPEHIWIIGTEVPDRNTEQQVRRLIETEARLEDFSRIVAHDLKAPIRGAGQLVRWLREDLGDSLESGTERHLSLLEDRVQKMETLLTGLSRFTRSTQEIDDPGEVNLNELVKACADLGEDFDLELGPMPTIVTPRAPLSHVLTNLIRNAVNHHDGRAKVLVKAESQGESFAISVTDDGPGIPERLQHRVFSMFLTLNQDGEEHSGIGLSIVQRIVERVGGELRCESPVADGRGTCMTVLWPLHWRRRTR